MSYGTGIFGWLDRRGGGSVQGFWGECRGSAPIETAVAVSVLAVTLVGLMEIVHAVQDEDYMGRAARAAARAVALEPITEESRGTLVSIACTAIQRELALDESFDCSSRWVLTVDTGLTPEALLAGGSADDGAGDMVMVRIVPVRGVGEESGEEDGATLQVAAVGVARSEWGSGG